MTKKLFIGLALVATIALATGPGVAQAAPHWFKNAAKVPEGQKIQTVGWGTLTFQTVLGGTASYECHVAEVGTVENPLGGGAGKGEVQLFSEVDCAFSACTTFAAVTAESLPWLEETEEVATEKFRDKISGVKLDLQCWGTKAGYEKAAREEKPAQGEELLNKNILVSREGSTCCKGETPLLVRGTSALHPDKVNFDSSSGKLEQENSSETIQGEIFGRTTELGYEEQELINVQ